MKHSIVCLSLALAAAGCVTSPRKTETTPPPAAEPALSTAVDPWARSVPAATPSAPAAPAAPAEAPMTTSTPAKSAATAVAPTEATADATDASGRRTHVVAKGETLFSIARKYYGDGTKWPRIVEANKGLKPESLSVGKTIVVP